MTLSIYKKPSTKIKKIIGVASGKGGVGKSFIAIAIARSLQKMGYKVGVLDADLYGPSVKKSLTEERAAVRDGEWIIPSKGEGILFVSMASFKLPEESITVRAPIANQLIDLFLNKTLWGEGWGGSSESEDAGKELDYLIIDFPPGTGDIQIQLAQSANLNGVILVTTPQEMSLIDVRRAASLFQSVSIPIIGLVENMSYFVNEMTKENIYIFGKNGGNILSTELQSPLLAQIPLDPDLGRLADLGFSFYNSDKPSLKIIKDLFNHIAIKVVGFTSPSCIKSMGPLGSDAFKIEWEDGEYSRFDLYELQLACPCASCLGNGSSQKPVFAKGVKQVGRYALKIDFESGCINGIYSLDYLRKLGKKYEMVP